MNSTELSIISDQWESRGISHHLYENRGIITVSKIVVPKVSRGTGLGTAAMKELMEYADKTSQRIVLSPSTDFGGTKHRLLAFYKRLGFVKNSGHHKNFAVSETMIREPKLVAQAKWRKALANTLPRGKKLNKPFRTPGESKKFAVYVKMPSGRIKLVRFGDPNLRIRQSDPKRRASFRARHKCGTKTDKTTPGYWSCQWSWPKRGVAKLPI
jgi:predicted GNAT family acetyltransferase